MTQLHQCIKPALSAVTQGTAVTCPKNSTIHLFTHRSLVKKLLKSPCDKRKIWVTKRDGLLEEKNLKTDRAVCAYSYKQTNKKTILLQWRILYVLNSDNNMNGSDLQRCLNMHSRSSDCGFDLGGLAQGCFRSFIRSNKNIPHSVKAHGR